MDDHSDQQYLYSRPLYEVCSAKSKKPCQGLLINNEIRRGESQILQI